ncbi:MAG: SDR family NAD(P)-dependent oxidoreductase [Sulfolobales archaeon]
MVTGASSGIGLELSKLLCRESNTIVLGVARRADRLEALASKFGTCFKPLVADLSTISGVNSVVKTVSEELGRIDLLVNNAGFGLYKRVLEHDESELVSMAMVNFIAPVLLTQKLAPFMNRGSAVVFVITAGIHVLMRTLPIYGATKIALHYTVELLRSELEERGIHVLSVYPGAVKTEFHLRAGGNPTDGIDASEVAKAVLRAIRSRKDKVYVPRYLSFLRVFGPHLAVSGPLPRNSPRRPSASLNIAEATLAGIKQST